VARSIADKSLFLNTGQLGIFMKFSRQFITFSSPIMLSAILSACGGGESTLEPSAATVAPSVAATSADALGTASKTGQAATGRSTGLEDGGSTIARPVPTRRRGGWQEVQPVVSNAGYMHRIATDDAGNALLIFTAADEFGYQSLYAKLYSAQNQSWSKGIALEAMPQDVKGLLLASNAAGEAVVSWTQNKQVFSTRFDPTTQTFDAVQRVDNLPGEAAATCSTLDKEGNATVVILNTPTSNAPGNVYHNDVYAVRYNINQGWETSPKKLELLPGAAFSAKCAVDDTGRVAVVWTQTTKYVGPAEPVEEIDPVTGQPVIVYVSPILGYATAVYYNYYDKTRSGNVGPWSSAQRGVASGLSAGNHYLHDLAHNAKGDLMLAYSNNQGVHFIGAGDDVPPGYEAPIRYGQLDWGSFPYGTGTAEPNAARPLVALDKEGNAVALWVMNGTVVRTMRYTRDAYSPSFGWSAPELAFTVTGGTIASNSGLSFSMNPEGKGLFAYNGGPVNTYAHNYDFASNSWTAAELMGGSANAALDTGPVQTSMNSTGTGVVSWEHDNIISTRFYRSM
jgi:hypothetical protein